MAGSRRRTGLPITGRWRRWTLLTPLLATLSLVLTAPASTAAVSAAPTNAKPRPVTTSYENPLAPSSRATARSTAAPTRWSSRARTARRSTASRSGTCTAPRTRSTTRTSTPSGDPIFHRIPMNVSTDLVNWTYVGDAFPLDGGDIPDWIDPTPRSGLPRSSTPAPPTSTTCSSPSPRRPRRAVGRTPARGDSAIGVAVGDSPTGPWEFADEPVVQPRLDPNGGPCSYFWTFDPDVLGDTVTDEGILYYGSYYGGIFATEVTFTETGVTAVTAATADDTRITIGNRYEGANVVYKDGYYYLFASATNCCNGALTGYSVFVGRSTSPFGPFVDKEGNSFLDAAVGGTPFLTMNGNRWVGTGHNSVFVDEGGQWWTVYHAVDQEDPFYAFDPGFTKRPALLDPVDWVNGWPVVNGGAGRPTPRCRHRRPRRASAAATRPSSSSPRWSTGSSTETSSPAAPSTVTGRGPGPDRRASPCRGRPAAWEVEHTDLYVDSNTASVLVRDAPTGTTSSRPRCGSTGPAGRGLLLQLRPGRTGHLRGRRQLHQADGHLDLGDPADGVRQGAQPGARGLEPLRQHRRRPTRGRLDLPADRRGAPHRCRAARGRRRHRALHRLHEPGRHHVGRGGVDAQPGRRRPHRLWSRWAPPTR